MGRYNGTLHKLIDSASAGNSKTKWNQVLHYLEGHTIADNKVPNPGFESPLPPYSSPSIELEAELFDQQGPKREDSPLKIAVKAAPAVVVAALCHLGQEAATLADSRERLPIHWACRRSSDDPETEKVISILAMCAPESLLHRDDGGRTPLHWVFWYHAASRSPKLVKFLCRDLPPQCFRDIRQPQEGPQETSPLPQVPMPGGNIPSNAAIIPDNRHGALPLHYAVMQGANKDVMKALISKYPESLACGDRKGRTALAWYFGAGHLLDNNKKHICGEANDPNATPWWYVKLSPTLIQLLVSSKVARVTDDLGRTPLHWACHFYTRSTVALEGASLPMKAFQILVDNNIQALTMQDGEGQTPLHVLFDVVAEQQDLDHQRHVANRTLRDNIDLTSGGPVAFEPAKELVELLIKSPESDGQDQGFRFDTGRDDKATSASYVEDNNGFLPLHIALRTATSPEVVQLLIQSNPTSVVHTSEHELQTPLIHAYSSEYSAPLQVEQTFELLMAAYVTSRHGTFMDGRLALKMEDANGAYPIHYACQNQASLQTIRLFVEKFPRCAAFQNADGDLPVHSLLSSDCLFDVPHNGLVYGATLAQTFAGLQTEKEIAWHKKVKETCRQKMEALINPLLTPAHLKIASSAHGMTPLHVAVAFRAVPYATIYRMLDTYPDAVKQLTTVKGYEFTCMDLHEMAKEESEDTDEWDGVRELLFSFNPLLDDYRRREDLLEACVKMIRSEIDGAGSFHFQQIIDGKIKKPANLDLCETLSSLALPEIDVAYRPQSSRRNRLEKQQRKPMSTTPKKSPGMNLTDTFSFGGEKKKTQVSIYDDDLGDRYVVSPTNSDDDDDDDFLSSEEEEEYFSDDDYDSTGSGVEEGTSLEQSSQSWDQGFSSGPSGTNTDSMASPTSGNSPSKIKSQGSKRKTRKRGQSSSNHFEEKKEELAKEPSMTSPRAQAPFLSDAAMRLWCFFVLYYDPKNPEDNYIKQVEAILDELDFEVIEQLISLPLPDYAEEYLQEGTTTTGVTLRDVSCPTSMALFHSFNYFLAKYEFPSELEGRLLHRHVDGNTFYIKVTEHTISTEEYLPKQELAPGAAEEAIWATGEKVVEEGGYVASKFVDKKRSAYIKFSRNQEAFENEVQCRAHLGLESGDLSLSRIVPLLDSFTSSGDSKKSRRYHIDVNDERFQTLELFGGESICLSDFPYALIYPHSDEGDLFDYFFHHGTDGVEEIVDISRQVATALKMIHEKGIVHGNMSMRNVQMVPIASDDTIARRTWAVSDLSTATRSQEELSCVGAISHNGSAQFSTGLLPPEMFVKLTGSEAQTYQRYWETVEEIYKVKVDKRVVEPFVNTETGSSYVLRCHYVPPKASNAALPALPYELVPARESTDVWCFGLILFALCSGGRPVVPANLKTGHLLDYESIVGWTAETAASLVYENVQNPLAQDVLIRLLAPYEDRVNLTMETVLNHPFFNKQSEKPSILEKIVEERNNESAAHDRWRTRVLSEKSVDDWLDKRTTSLECWNFDLLRRISSSSTQILGRLLGDEKGPASMPYCFVLLPYKLSLKNKKAKLAPTTKKDVERAERMGVVMLSLAKACFFGCQIQDHVAAAGDTQWTASKLLEGVSLPDGDFESMKEDFAKIAATNIESFRSEPLSAVHKLVARCITDIRLFFKEAGRAYLYLVDEYGGVPLVGAAYAPYPLEISDSIIDRFVVRALPFMHICDMHARAVSGGVTGLVRLIFEAAYPHVPPSWAHAATGLPHSKSEDHMVKESTILRQALSSLYSSKANTLSDDMRFIRDSCAKLDKEGTFAEMQRVVGAGCSLWTTPEGASEIQASCETFGFKEALEIQESLEAKLKEQETHIKNLQKQMERLAFRKELNLEVPDETTGGPSGVPHVVTTPKAVSQAKAKEGTAVQPTGLSQVKSKQENGASLSPRKTPKASNGKEIGAFPSEGTAASQAHQLPEPAATETSQGLVQPGNSQEDDSTLGGMDSLGDGGSLREAFSLD